MGDIHKLNLKPRRSFYIQESPKESIHSEPLFKSDFNISSLKYSDASCSYRGDCVSLTKNSHGEYYKKYEHDEKPVKESNFNESNYIRGGKVSLTDSALDKLEMKVFNNVSQELQTVESSISSLESNIHFFKTTVQEIFDNFYNSMKDFEMYKKRFNDILAKNQQDSLADMEEFIKDMIQHIMSGETSVSKDSCRSIEMTEIGDKDTYISNTSPSATNTTSGEGRLFEAYKNDNYLTDSTLDNNSSKLKRYSDKEEIFNIYLLNGAPCVQIKMNDRSLLSEINIRNNNSSDTKNCVASAENLKKLAAKKMELENYVRKEQENMPDRDIPVKVSYAKKNIHLNEDFTRNDNGDTKSFMSKICSFLCNKFRKTSFG